MRALSAREYLRSRAWQGARFGLGAMRTLCAELGHPERAYKTVLIAGTNGKGSVCAYLDAGLRKTGLRVGLYTSPHLEDIRERIVVQGRKISRSRFEEMVARVRDTASGLVSKNKLRAHPSHFEILTAAAFLFFKDMAVDIAVLEVGLGGRLDATNVSAPLVSAIVSVDFDHEQYLGSTLHAIATEKAHVCRARRTLVLGPMKREAHHAAVSVARSRGASVVDTLVRFRADSIQTRRRTYANITTLRGSHQKTNFAVAAAVMEEIGEVIPSLDIPRAISGMGEAQWPGRLEEFAGRPTVLLDGAHNPAGAHALAAYLKSNAASGVLVFGAMQDKHIDAMAKILFPAFRIIVATRVRMKRAAPYKRILGASPKGSPSVLPSKGPKEALTLARRLARRGEVVVVAGSLYLVGAVRRLLRMRRTGVKRQATGRVRAS